MPLQPYRRERRAYDRPRGYSGMWGHWAWTLWALVVLGMAGWCTQALLGQLSIPSERSYRGTISYVANPVFLELPEATFIAEVLVIPGQRIAAGDPLVEFDVDQLSTEQTRLQTRLSAQEFLLACLEQRQSAPPADPLNPTLASALKQAERACVAHHDTMAALRAPLLREQTVLQARREVVLQALKLVLATDRSDMADQVRKSLILRQELNAVDASLRDVAQRLVRLRNEQKNREEEALQTVRGDIDAIYSTFSMLSERMISPVVTAQQSAIVSALPEAKGLKPDDKQRLTLIPVRDQKLQATLNVPKDNLESFPVGTQIQLQTGITPLDQASLMAVTGAPQPSANASSDMVTIPLSLSSDAKAALAVYGAGLDKSLDPIGFTVTAGRQRRPLWQVMQRAFSKDAA